MNCELVNQDQQSISELHMNAQSINLLRNMIAIIIFKFVTLINYRYHQTN